MALLEKRGLTDSKARCGFSAATKSHHRNRNEQPQFQQRESSPRLPRLLFSVQLTSHTMRVVPTPNIDSNPMVVPRLATTMVMPVRAREYLDLCQERWRRDRVSGESVFLCTSKMVRDSCTAVSQRNLPQPSSLRHPRCSFPASSWAASSVAPSWAARTATLLRHVLRSTCSQHNDSTLFHPQPPSTSNATNMNKQPPRTTKGNMHHHQAAALAGTLHLT